MWLKSAIGEKEDDPVVFVSDLLIQLVLGRADGEEGKGCDRGERIWTSLIGSRPLAETEGEDEEEADREAVKANILGNPEGAVRDGGRMTSSPQSLEIVPADKGT